jgi:hypothetical protein
VSALSGASGIERTKELNSSAQIFSPNLFASSARNLKRFPRRRMMLMRLIEYTYQ